MKDFTSLVKHIYPLSISFNQLHTNQIKVEELQSLSSCEDDKEEQMESF
jgi:hypothetical protein